VEIIQDLSTCPEGEGFAVTIGMYDGVHLGHRAVIGEAQAAGRRLGVPTAVVTFDPHPAFVLRPESAPKLLCSLEQKLELLAAAGVDATVVVPFDEVRAAETPAEFVESVLVDCLRSRAVVVGRDFHFGKGRTGNVSVLSELGRHFGFEVAGVALLARPDGTVEAVSSTAIRTALAAGDLATATRLLGRHHEVRGRVTSGDRRGRTIGFPTANVAVPLEFAIPADGVYAAWYLRPDGRWHPAAVNLGRRPTFYDAAAHSLLEAHLIDFDGDLYGEAAAVRFVARLRDETRFDGIDALRAQLARDIDTARAVLDADRDPR
jgi:riboflavin kinase / FMN adenylyltransferase